LRAPEHS